MKSVFKEADPSLSAVRLMGMDGGERGSCLKLKVALNYDGANPPVRWQRIDANALSIEMLCFGLQELSMAMQPGDSTVTCDITKDPAGNQVLRIAGPSIDLVIRCGYVRINHILPYTAESFLAGRGSNV
jgi:immunity protein 50 of polymorphic toxin system